MSVGSEEGTDSVVEIDGGEAVAVGRGSGGGMLYLVLGFPHPMFLVDTVASPEHG